jgi:hypothetical protein
MVAAGIAQVARTHSARLQEPPPNITPKKEDLKQLSEQYEKQSDKNKLISLRTIDYFVRKEILNLMKVIGQESTSMPPTKAVIDMKMDAWDR